MKVKIPANVFFEKQELNRLQKSFEDWGFKRNILLQTKKFGLFENFSIPEIGSNITLENCYKVSKAGTPIDEIVIAPGAAIDKNGNIILLKQSVNFPIINDSTWYWVKIKHKFTPEEAGTVSVDTDGILTGIGTEFTQILRGQPNYPVRISFTDSTLNTQVYEVVKIISDTQAILSGDFQNESNIKYKVFGCFTAGAIVPSQDQYIYQYDNCEITLVAETTLNTAPSLTDNEEFFISRVRMNGITLEVQDKRNNFWKTESGDYVKFIDRLQENFLIGVESAKFKYKTTPRSENEVNFCWSFRSINYTFDTSSNKITINSGNGGKYKSTSDFIDDQFNGWRLYSKNGLFRTIVESKKVGSQINLTLDILNADDYNGTDQILLTPPVEFIEIRARRDGSQTADIKLIEKIIQFPINTDIGKIELITPSPLYSYNVTYRYKLYNDYTDWKVFPDDSVGFYDESSFDSNGVLNSDLSSENPSAPVNLKPYVGHITDGFIQLVKHPNSYDSFVASIDLTEIKGVRRYALSNSVPQLLLTCGVDKQYQVFDFSETSLTADMFIILNNKLGDNVTTIKEGYKFFIQFVKSINLNTFKLRLVQNFVNPTNFELIKEISQDELNFIDSVASPVHFVGGESTKSGFFFDATFDGTNWFINWDNETDVRSDKANAFSKIQLLSSSSATTSGAALTSKLILSDGGNLQIVTPAIATNIIEIDTVNNQPGTIFTIKNNGSATMFFLSSKTPLAGGLPIFLSLSENAGFADNWSFTGSTLTTWYIDLLPGESITFLRDTSEFIIVSAYDYLRRKLAHPWSVADLTSTSYISADYSVDGNGDPAIAYLENCFLYYNKRGRTADFQFWGTVVCNRFGGFNPIILINISSILAANNLYFRSAGACDMYIVSSIPGDLRGGGLVGGNRSFQTCKVDMNASSGILRFWTPVAAGGGQLTYDLGINGVFMYR